LTAVVISGGKQHRVAPGDRFLVDRLDAETGSEIRLDRVLMVSDRDNGQVRIKPAELMGVTISAKVIGHPRGPKIDVLRYHPKKRVRVHRGERANLTALEVLSIDRPDLDYM
jgi:large subunit ribosomal protein L21